MNTTTIHERIRRFFPGAMTVDQAERELAAAQSKAEQAQRERDTSDHPLTIRVLADALVVVEDARRNLERAKERQAQAEAKAADATKHAELEKLVRAAKTLDVRVAPLTIRVLAARGELAKVNAELRTILNEHNADVQAAERLARELGVDTTAPLAAGDLQVRGAVDRAIAAATRGEDVRVDAFPYLRVTT